MGFQEDSLVPSSAQRQTILHRCLALLQKTSWEGIQQAHGSFGPVFQYAYG